MPMGKVILTSAYPEFKAWGRRLEAVDFTLNGGYSLIGKPLFGNRTDKGNFKEITFNVSIIPGEIVAIGVTTDSKSQATKNENYCYLFEIDKIAGNAQWAVNTSTQIETENLTTVFVADSATRGQWFASTILDSANKRLAAENQYTVPGFLPYTIKFQKLFNVNFQAGVTIYATGRIPFRLSPSIAERDDIPMVIDPNNIKTQADLQALLDFKKTTLDNLEQERQKLLGASPPNAKPHTAQANIYAKLPGPVGAATDFGYDPAPLTEQIKVYQKKLPKPSEILEYLESKEGQAAANELYEGIIKRLTRTIHIRQDVWEDEVGDELGEIFFEGGEIIGIVTGYIMMKFRGEDQPFWFMDGLINHMDTLDKMDDKQLALLERVLLDQSGRFLGASKTMEILAQIVGGRKGGNG